MERREFITLLGGVAAAWPLAARAQERAMPVVGFLRTGLPETDANIVAAFRKGLSENGFAEGRNLSVEYRWARNNFDLVPALVDELVHRGVSVIAASGIRFALVAKAATKTIPIVFETGGDPVEDGLVASFNRPGGNVTGVTAISRELDAKKLALLCELAPGAVRIGLLTDLNALTTAANESRITAVRTAAASIGRQIEVLPASTSREIDDSFANLAQKRIDALVVTASQLFYGYRVQIATLAARHAVPTMYWDRPMVEAGGLMSYGSDNVDQFRLIGVYAGRILKGEKPADLPVLRPTRFEFVINLQTARALGIEVPPTLLALTDAVIE